MLMGGGCEPGQFQPTISVCRRCHLAFSAAKDGPGKEDLCGGKNHTANPQNPYELAVVGKTVGSNRDRKPHWFEREKKACGEGKYKQSKAGQDLRRRRQDRQRYICSRVDFLSQSGEARVGSEGVRLRVNIHEKQHVRILIIRAVQFREGFV